MDPKVESLVKSILWRIERFDRSVSAYGRYPRAAAADDEVEIDDDHAAIVRTSGERVLVGYADIVAAHMLTTKGDEAPVIELSVRDGRRVRICTEGGTGHFKDAYEILRFFMRVAEST